MTETVIQLFFKIIFTTSDDRKHMNALRLAYHGGVAHKWGCVAQYEEVVLQLTGGGKNGGSVGKQAARCAVLRRLWPEGRANHQQLRGDPEGS